MESPQLKADLDLLSKEDRSSPKYKKAKENFKGSLKVHISSPGCAAHTGKYVLASNLFSDGVQLKIHAYSLVQPKKKTKTDETINGNTQNSNGLFSLNKPVDTQDERMKASGRSVVYPDSNCSGSWSEEDDKAHKFDPKSGLVRDRDHNAGQKMANATLEWMRNFKCLESLDRSLVNVATQH
ncbi:hypothetical protein BGZ76_010149 [Entomortierella beljakovae]|nr:hypothetical protein BGZ76_010149 [Entomortierella beljakovae]